MSRDELLRKLRELRDVNDTESAHADADADEALIAFIADPEITEAYEAISKWYA